MKGHRLEKVDIIGVSGGSPFALTCAEQLGSKIGKVAIICGLTPLDTDESKNSVAEEDLLLMYAAQNEPEQVVPEIQKIHSNPERMVKELTSELTDFDKKIISPELIEKLPKVIKEATRSPEGMINDYKLFGKPWGVDFNEINNPVFFWHGDEDKAISVRIVRSFVDRIKGAKFKVIEGAGHFGTAVAGPELAIKHFASNV